MQIIARYKFYSAAALALLLTAVAFAFAAPPAPPPPPPPPPPPAVTFGITWLDDTNVFDATFTDIHFRGMNNLGDAVGYGYCADSLISWAYTDETGTFDVADVALPPVDGDTLQVYYCNDINDQRQIGGTCYLNGIYRPFRLLLPTDPETGALVLNPGNGLPMATRVEIVPEPVEARGDWTSVDRINNHGDVLVHWRDVAGATYNRSSLFADGSYIHTTAVKSPNWRMSVNEFGVVVGAHQSPTDGRTYGFRSSLDLETQSQQSFTTFPGFVAPGAYDTLVSSAHGVNDAGDIVGGALFTQKKKVKGAWKDATRHAFRRSGATMTDLGTLNGHSNSRACGINSVGDVIGLSSTTDVYAVYGDSTSGFLWTAENKMHDLDTLVLPDERWISATSILPQSLNDPATPLGFGQIGGQALIPDDNGNAYWRPFILTPIE